MTAKKPKKAAPRASSKTPTPKAAGMEVGGSTGFDGANYSRQRGFVFSGPENRHEITTFTRTELNRKAKVYYNNLPPLRYLAKAVARHSVGIGIFPMFLTSDEEWNALAEREFNNWASNASVCDAKKQRTFWQRQRQCIYDFFRQGESFVSKAFGPMGGCMFQSFLDHEIRNGKDDKDPAKIFDGVVIGSRGERIGYRVATADGAKTIYTNAMCHIVDLEREDQFRSPTILFSGINDAQDYMEIKANQKFKQKLQSSIIAFLKREAGRATARGAVGQLATSSIKKSSASSSSTATIAESSDLRDTLRRAIETFGGGGALAYLNPGEEIQFPEVAKDDAFPVLTELLLREFAWSIGVSPDVLFFLAKLGGTTNRAGLEDFAAYVLALQDLINEQLNTPFLMWVVSTAMADGKLRRCKDPVWWEHVWQGPPKMSVDLGRMGALMINLRNNAMITLAEYYTGRGLDWRQQQRQIAREIRFEKLACWEASDHQPGEVPLIDVDYYRDFRNRPGQTILPPEEDPKKGLGKSDTGDEEYRPGQNDES